MTRIQRYLNQNFEVAGSNWFTLIRFIFQVRDSIKIINVGDISLTIELPNNKNLWIRTFSCNSKTLNVLLLFECRFHWESTVYFNFTKLVVFSSFIRLDCDQYTLYAGRFIASDSDLFSDRKMNNFLRHLMIAKKIDELCIDLTTAHISEFNLGRQACDEIEAIIRNKYVLWSEINDRFL